MKTACILAAVTVVYLCEADTVKAKGPRGSNGVSNRSSGSRYMRATNFSTYNNQVFTPKPILTPTPALVQKTEIVSVKTADLKPHLYHKDHRHRREGIDVPDVELSDPVMDDNDADESCELADSVSDAKPTQSLSAGTPAADDADDDDDDDDD